MDTKEQLVANIKEWLKNDTEISNLQAEIKVRRKNKKMTRRMRGGDKRGIINSQESLLSFLKMISKLSEPYYVIFTGPRVIEFLELLGIKTDNIREAQLDDIDRVYPNEDRVKQGNTGLGDE